ncbi:FUSC family protein [Nocardioides bizhenqiangii]|uniref:FUSC family protein n=1 Tax=Nocardioides bizhenqiangii TaxID=3095076 RepID=A0ABZ0ZT13_9ACTN|nr:MULTISPECIES: FUSC family protein [unclassified Nocardioides]MDZ5621980.1 FUSC family protein [Nocardioides sp. HM23]WQQ27342.1 FUSC family protein [Nocardioides sp. HM61]
MEVPLDRMWERSRLSVRGRVERWRRKLFAVVQCAIAAGVAWWLAADVFDHQTPFFAPIAAVVSLGTSYGQRLRRVAEVTFGVAIGVFVADLLVVSIGTGAWQLALIVGLAMSAALLLDAGNLFVTQAAVQSIVVATLLPDPDAALTRWTDALIGGGVALVAATVVPAAPLRKPREQAASVARKIAELLRAASHVMIDGETDPALDLLADARATDRMIRELQAAAEEGVSVVASSPFRVRHREGLRRMVELVDPLDRSLRSTRVLVRQAAVAAYRHRPVPSSYADLTADLALAVDAVADELAADRMPEAARPRVLAVGEATGMVERSPSLSGDAILAQLRSIVVDLLLVTGMGQLEATDALPPPRR